MSNYAPILLFIYNRPHHLDQTIEDLISCKGFNKHDLIVIGDGPKNIKDKDNVYEARRVAMNKLGTNVKYVFSDKNKGLASSIISGVTEFIDKYGKAIIIEDDLKLHKNFLLYMNDALNFYENNDLVYSISGYAYKDMNELLHDKPLFLPCISTWGWGTWKHKWESFDFDCEGSEDLLADYKLKDRFNIDSVYPFSEMLASQKKGEIESWGIRWYWTLFSNGKLCCYPKNSLVINDGYDNSATNGRGWANNFSNKKEFSKNIRQTEFLNNDVKVDEHYYKEVVKALFDLNGGYFGMIKDKIKKLYTDTISFR